MAKKRLVSAITSLALTSMLAAAGYVALPAQAATNTGAQKAELTQQQNLAYPHSKHHKGKYGHLQQIATIIGVDVKTLKESLKNGQSIVDVAQSKGNKISEQELIAKLKVNLKDRLDKKVAKGKLTQDQANHILSQSDQHLKKFVENRALFQHKMKHKYQHGGQEKQGGTTFQKEPSSAKK